MKKYNKANQNTILLGIILPILAFFISMNATYAYFSAISSQNKGVSTGVLSIKFSGGTNAIINTNEITESTIIVPGEQLTIYGTIENDGDTPVFAIIELKIEACKYGETEKQTIETKYYSLNEATPIEIYEIAENSFTATAFALEVPDAEYSNDYSRDFLIPYDINFNTFGNDYQNGTLSYTLTGHAIQQEYIDDASIATGHLLDELN